MTTKIQPPIIDSFFIYARNLHRETAEGNGRDLSTVAIVNRSAVEIHQDPAVGNHQPAENGRCQRATLSRCACHAVASRTSASFSLEEMSVSHVESGDHQLSPTVINRSVSYEGAWASYSTKHGRVDANRSRSDSSINHESNMSEDGRDSMVFNYFDYQSLESLASSSITDCNSIQANFDDESPVNLSPSTIVDDEPATAKVSHDDDNDDVVQVFESPPVEEEALAEPSERPLYHNHICSNCPTENVGQTAVESAGPIDVESLDWAAPKSQHSSSASGRKSSVKTACSQSREKRRRRSKKQKLQTVAYDPSAARCSVSNPEMLRPSLTRHGHGQSARDWSILPIFKQLIAQKHQETGHPRQQQQQHQRQQFDDANEEGSVSDRRQRAMSSCPNLSIKCDVVEYF